MTIAPYERNLYATLAPGLSQRSHWRKASTSTLAPFLTLRDVRCLYCIIKDILPNIRWPLAWDNRASYYVQVTKISIIWRGVSWRLHFYHTKLNTLYCQVEQVSVNFWMNSRLWAKQLFCLLYIIRLTSNFGTPWLDSSVKSTNTLLSY